MTKTQSATQRQGQCLRCKIAWVWSRRIRLRDQTCAHCGGPLALIRAREIEGMKEAGFTWFTWEGYNWEGYKS